jgi:hypothetical protein
MEYDYQRIGIEYFGGIKNGEEIKEEKNKMSISLLQVIENNKRKSNKKIESFDFKLIRNPNGKLCTSYPEKFLLPSQITYEQIEKICGFRARERLPIITFMYKGEDGRIYY